MDEHQREEHLRTAYRAADVDLLQENPAGTHRRRRPRRHRALSAYPGPREGRSRPSRHPE